MNIHNYTPCLYLRLDVCLLVVGDAGFHNGALAATMHKIANAANHDWAAAFCNRLFESAPIAILGIPALTSQ